MDPGALRRDEFDLLDQTASDTEVPSRQCPS